MNIRNKKNTIRFYSAAYIIGVVLIVIILNMLMEVAEEKFPFKIDMTGNKVFTLSEGSKEFLSNLEEEFEIYVLSDETIYKNGLRTGVVNEILLQYKRLSKGKINLTYIDIYKNPGILSKYQNDDLQEHQLIVEGENGYMVVKREDLYTTKANTADPKARVSELTAERAITYALARLSTETLKKIYLLTGHGEKYSDGVVKIIQSGAYKLDEISLTNNHVPSDADLILINSPRVDFSIEEISRLDDFLQSFGNIILLCGSETASLPNLDNYLKEWGVEFERNIIVDPTSYIGNVLQTVPKIVDVDINNKVIGFKDRYILTPGSRNINVLWQSHNKREVNPVLITSEKSYTKSYDNESGLISTIDQKEEDKKGISNIAVLVQNFDFVEKEFLIGKLLFLSSPAMLSDSLLETENLLNNYYFSDVLSYMSGGKETISIESKSMRDNALTTVNVDNLTLFFLIVVAPSLSILIFGVFRYRSRRGL